MRASRRPSSHSPPRLVAVRLADLGTGRVETPPANCGRLDQVVGKGRQEFVSVGPQSVPENAACRVHGGGRRRVRHRGPHRPGRRREAACGDGRPSGSGRDVLKCVGLVQHNRVVGREDLRVGEHMKAVEVVVHHQHIHISSLVPGPLGEALRPRRAVRGAGALPPGHAHRLPGPGGRLDVETSPVPVGGLGRPDGQACDLLADPVGLSGRVRRDQLSLLAAGSRGQVGELLAADVIRPALQHRVLERHSQSLRELGKILVHELILEGLGGGGHDSLLPARHQRREVGHRLASAGAGRDYQMPVLVEGRRDRLTHFLLPGSPLAAARHR